MIALTLPYPPSKNRLWRNVGNRTLLSREARDYQQTVNVEIALQFATRRGNFPKPLTGAVTLTLTFYRPRKVGDVDGRLPFLIDCLQGHAYVNDSQVVEIHAYRKEDKERPRVEVEVSLLTEGNL